MSLAEFKKSLSKVFQEQVEMTPKIVVKDESVSVSIRAFVPYTKSNHASVCTAKFSKEDMKAVKPNTQLMYMLRYEDVKVHTMCWGAERTQKYYNEFHNTLEKLDTIAREDPCESDTPVLSDYDKAVRMLILLLHSLGYWETTLTVLVMGLGNIAQTSGCEANCKIATRILKDKIEAANSNIEVSLHSIKRLFPTITLSRKSFDVTK